VSGRDSDFRVNLESSSFLGARGWECWKTSPSHMTNLGNEAEVLVSAQDGQSVLER
jgi:hypothetical protein